MLAQTPWRRVWGDGRRPRWKRFSPWLKNVRGVAGVYLIRSRLDHNLLYIGRSVDLGARLRRHFYRHKGVDPVIPREVAEARVYVLPHDALVEAERRLIVLYPHALNVDRPSDNAPF